MLINPDGRWSGTVGVGDLALFFFQCNVDKRYISLFREIESIWVKAVAIETVISLVQRDCLLSIPGVIGHRKFETLPLALYRGHCAFANVQKYDMFPFLN